MKLLKLVPDNTNIPFLKVRIVTFIVSIMIMAASIGAVITQGLNFGVDFIGGQMIQATISDVEQAPVEEIRTKVNSLGYGEPTIQRFGEPNQISIRMKLPEGAEDEPELANEMATSIVNKLKEDYPNTVIDGVDSVSGKVSSELFSTGVTALLAAMFAIALYIWVRFEWQFGVGALFALMHDVVLTFGLFAVTQLEFNLNIIAALLTIIGYSLNDTIVVYDRIRENLKKYRKMDMPALLDLSVNETLARTVMTSITILVPLVILMIFGPKVIFGFAAAMAFGVLIGTYSSVYMAAPILIWLKVGPDSFIPVDDGKSQEDKMKEGYGAVV